MKTPFEDFFRSGACVFTIACILLGIAAWLFHSVAAGHESDLAFHTRQLKDDAPRRETERGMLDALAMVAVTNAPLREFLLDHGYIVEPNKSHPGMFKLTTGPRMGVHP